MDDPVAEAIRDLRKRIERLEKRAEDFKDVDQILVWNKNCNRFESMPRDLARSEVYRFDHTFQHLHRPIAALFADLLNELGYTYVPARSDSIAKKEEKEKNED